MPQRPQRGRRQAELFARSKQPTIDIDENHRFVQVTDELDWSELEELVESIRRSKVKSAAGRPSHLRALSGALVFRSVRKTSYRDTRTRFGTTLRRDTCAG